MTSLEREPLLGDIVEGFEGEWEIVKGFLLAGFLSGCGAGGGCWVGTSTGLDWASVGVGQSNISQRKPQTMGWSRV